MRKKFFDDRVLFDPKTNEIWIGRPDTKCSDEPWQWFLITKRRGRCVCERSIGLPARFVELAREPEFSICGGPREL